MRQVHADGRLPGRDRAVDDELLGSLADHTDLYARYNTDKVFKAWLQERLFDAAKRRQNPARPTT